MCGLIGVATHNDSLIKGGLPHGRLIVIRRVDDADRVDHVRVSRREAHGGDAASSIAQNVGGINAELLLMMLQRTFLRDLWSETLTMTAATSSAANDHEKGCSIGPDFDRPWPLRSIATRLKCSKKVGSSNCG